jgi:hypothetical protein
MLRPSGTDVARPVRPEVESVGSSERESPWRMPVHHAQNVGMSTTMSDRPAGASVLARVVPVGAVAERVRDHATARPAWPVDVDGSWPAQVDWAWLSVDVAAEDPDGTLAEALTVERVGAVAARLSGIGFRLHGANRLHHLPQGVNDTDRYEHAVWAAERGRLANALAAAVGAGTARRKGHEHPMVVTPIGSFLPWRLPDGSRGRIDHCGCRVLLPEPIAAGDRAVVSLVPLGATPFFGYGITVQLRGPWPVATDTRQLLPDTAWDEMFNALAEAAHDAQLPTLRPRAGELILEADGRYGWGVERQFWYERARRSAG